MSHRGWCHENFSLPKPVGYDIVMLGMLVVFALAFVAADLIYRLADQDHTISGVQKRHLIDRALALQTRALEPLEKTDGHDIVTRLV